MIQPSAPAPVHASIRLYLMVGLILFCGTVATVAVATIPRLDVGSHGLGKADIALGLGIAATKALLVAAIFMHLNHERGLIYFLIGLAAIHCAGMVAFTLLAEADAIHDPHFYEGPLPPAPGSVLSPADPDR
jgi:caa(3)-type oxidase subunit IV